MDELEISGKRYISSKRIAKENKYHADYIGQLIRGGKIVGTKVGRAWYVEEQSFADYLNKDDTPYTPSPSIPAYVPPTPVITPVPVAVAEIVPTVIIKEEPIIITQTVEKRTVPPPNKTVLTYVSDSNPLFPQIVKRKNYAETQALYQPEANTAAAPEKVSKGSGVLRTGFAVVSLTVVAAALFSVVFFGSLGISSTIDIEKGKPASVAYSQEKTFCFIFKTCQK